MALVNALLVRYAAGYTWVEDATSIAAYGRREGYLALGSAQSVSEVTRVAGAVLGTHAQPAVATTAGLEPTGAGDEPYADFAVGDWITVPDAGGAPASMRVQALTVTEDAEGNPAFVPELRTLAAERERQLQRWLKRMANGALGGSVESATPGQIAQAQVQPSRATAAGGAESDSSPSVIHAYVERTSDQPIASTGTPIVVTFDGAPDDPSGVFDGSDTMTLPTDGLWLIECGIAYDTNANLQVDIASGDGSEQYARQRFGNASSEGASVTLIRRFNAGDSFRVEVTVSATGNVQGSSTDHVTHFSATRLAGGTAPLTLEEEMLADSPFVLYPMQEPSGTTMEDASGNGLNGTYSGGVTLGAGGMGSLLAAQFDGSNDYAQTPSLDLTGTPVVTLAFLAYVTTYTNDDNIMFEFSADSNSNRGWYIDPHQNAGAISLFINDGGAGPSDGWAGTISRAEAPAATWVMWHVVLDYSQPAASQIRVWIDGVEKSLTGYPFRSEDLGGNHANTVLNLMSRNGAAEFFPGRLAYVAVYDYALAEARIIAHATAAALS